MGKKLGMAILGLENSEKPITAVPEDIGQVETSYPLDTKEGSKAGTP